MNSGSAFSTVRTMFSIVCSEAAQRVCENLLNRVWDGTERGCLALPCRGRAARHTHTHTHADMHTEVQSQPRGGGSRTAREPGQSSAH